MITIDLNLILCIVAFAWHYALLCGYISDDHAAVAMRQDIIPDSEKIDRKESFWVKRFNDGIVMFYHTRFFWAMGLKDKPFYWHLFSLTLHLANTWLLVLFLTPFIGYHQSLLAAGFWAVNPMLNQNVVWISGRPYLFGTFFALISMIGWDNPLCFIPFYLLSILTNISAFFVPQIIWLIHHGWQGNLYILIQLAIGVPFIIWKFNKRFKNGLVIDRDNFKFKWRKLNTCCRIILYYLTTLFCPVRMGWYHQSGFRYNERWEKFNYLTLIGYGVIALFIFYFKFPGWLFLLGFLPNSNLYATNSFLQDRYVYFCSIGIAVIVSPYLLAYPQLFYVAMTFYVTRAYMYSRHLKDDEKLYRENWRNHPKSDYAINNLSFFLIQQRRYDEARVVVEHGLAVDRTNKMLWYNLGITYAAQGHFANDEGKFKFLKALECWKTCLQIEPRWNKPAQDLQKLIKLLVEHKVLVTDASQIPKGQGMTITVPATAGIKEIMDGTKTISKSVVSTT